MEKGLKKAVVSSIITGTIGLVATIIAANISSNIARKNATQEVINQIENGVATLNGDNANIIINDVDDVISDYEKLKIQNEGLNELNTQYAEQIKNNSAELESLHKQLDGTPVISFSNLSLCIDGENVPINSNDAMISVNGREYVSKEFVDHILTNKEELTIKDDVAYIGRIIADQSNLFDKWVVDSYNFEKEENCVDSYGNKRTNVLSSYSNSYVIYNLNGEYSSIKMIISIDDNAYREASTIVRIKADDTVVYTSPEIKKTSEPFEIVDIPVNNCTLLKIECDSNMVGSNVIISDAIVYN